MLYAVLFYSLLSAVLYVLYKTFIAPVKRPTEDIFGDDKFVLVTGAASGIGRATTLQLMSDRYNCFVFACDLNESALKKEFATFEAQGRCKCIKMDVSKLEDIEKAVEVVKETINSTKGREKRLFGLVNNAGIGQVVNLAMLVEKEDPEMLQQMAINYFGVARCTRSFYDLLSEDPCTSKPLSNSCIVNIGSIAGRIGGPFFGHYTASKYAVIGYSESLRSEMAVIHKSSPKHVRITCIEPSWTKTAILNLAPTKQNSMVAPAIDMVRQKLKDNTASFQEPETVADAIVASLFSSTNPLNYRVETKLLARIFYNLAIYLPHPWNEKILFLISNVPKATPGKAKSL